MGKTVGTWTWIEVVAPNGISNIIFFHSQTSSKGEKIPASLKNVLYKTVNITNFAIYSTIENIFLIFCVMQMGHKYLRSCDSSCYQREWGDPKGEAGSVI